MLITIRIDFPVRDPQGMKEAVAMQLEHLGRGIHVVDVRDESQPEQETMWRDGP